MTPTVFIVDDDDAIRDAMSLLLSTAGLNAVSYSDGQSFLADYRPDCPGCVLLDVGMPGMNGFEVLAELNERGSQTPVIFLTGHGDSFMAENAAKTGAAGFLQKPIQGEELINKVQRALEPK